MSEREKQALINTAKKASQNSYSPYSHFAVGAALMAENGEIFAGTNVENISFGATVCAERSALCSAVTAGVKKFKALAVYHEGELAYPCGVCRQMLCEFGDMDVFLSDGSQCRELKLSNLIPYNFQTKEIK